MHFLTPTLSCLLFNKKNPGRPPREEDFSYFYYVIWTCINRTLGVNVCLELLYKREAETKFKINHQEHDSRAQMNTTGFLCNVAAIGDPRPTKFTTMNYNENLSSRQGHWPRFKSAVVICANGYFHVFICISLFCGLALSPGEKAPLT